MDFVVIRDKWQRASVQCDDDVKLFDSSSGRMCCLGFCAIALGATEADIKGVSYPREVAIELPGLNQRVGGRGLQDTKLSDRATTINDDDTISDAEREVRLKTLFEEFGHTIRFE